MLESKNHPAAAELKSYADKHGGIDKEYFHSAANHIAAGRHRELAMHVKSGDTEPRDKVLDVLHKHDRPLSDKIHKAAGYQRIREGKKPGLWDNIHAKRKRIKAGSGERMRKPGSKGAPTSQDFKDASESTDAYGKSMDAIADKKKKDGISQADKLKLAKLDALMKQHRTRKEETRYQVGIKGEGGTTVKARSDKEASQKAFKNMGIADRMRKKIPHTIKKVGEETKPIKLRGFGPKGEKGNMGSSVARSHLMKKDTLIANPKTQKVSKVTSSRAKSAVKKGFVYAEDTNEGAMSRLDVQRQERERLGKDKVKGSGLKTYKKKTSEPSRSLSRMEGEVKELSTKTLTNYMSKASDARGHRNLSTKKVDNRYKGVATASKKLDKRLGEAKFGSEHGYKISHEKSVRGGYRAKLVNPQGKVSYLGGTSYKKPSHAKGEAQAYHDKYFGSAGMKANDRGAERAVADYRQKNKQHVHEGAVMLSFNEVAGQRGRPKKGEGTESDKHIIMQLRSVQDLHRMGGDKHVTFSGGQKAKVKPNHVNAILHAHDKLNPDGKRRLRVAIGRHPQGLHKVATALTKKR